MYYVGIGSRETPKEVLKLFEELGEILDSGYGLTLRSGHAAGADMAFEAGCDRVYGAKEIYLPWLGFNNSDSSLVIEGEKVFRLAKDFHPNWENLSFGAKRLIARNTYQLLGKNLETPSSFVVCWTKAGKVVGGTGQALRMAECYNIPVFNAGSYEDLVKFTEDVTNFASTLKEEKGVS